MLDDLFNEIYIKHKGLVINSVRLGLKGLPDHVKYNIEKDLVQDSFLEIWKRLPKFDSEKSSISTFVSNIGKWIALEYKKKWIRRNALLPPEYNISIEDIGIDQGGEIVVQPDNNKDDI
jgi:DNA-directed RNA polymerase specialized sigma24 family protein